MDVNVRMYDPHEGIQLPNPFVSYLEVLQVLARLPAHIQAVMIAYLGQGMPQEEVAEKFGLSDAR